jgi:DNA-binding transcriptional ArsR family regulator
LLDDFVVDERADEVVKDTFDTPEKDRRGRNGVPLATYSLTRIYRSGYLDRMQAAVFNALGEPNRLQIVELLRTSSFAVGEIAETLRIRQPQVSKHLKVLAASGIVRVEPRARQRIYHLQAEPFDRIARWIDSFEHLWGVRLDSLGDYLRTNASEEGQS